MFGCCRDVETILQAVNLDRRRLDDYLEEAPDEEDDMLEITFNQLPKGFMNREFDWSGQTNYAGMHRKARTAPAALQVILDMQEVTCILITVRQPYTGGEWPEPCLPESSP